VFLVLLNIARASAYIFHAAPQRNPDYPGPSQCLVAVFSNYIGAPGVWSELRAMWDRECAARENMSVLVGQDPRKAAQRSGDSGSGCGLGLRRRSVGAELFSTSPSLARTMPWSQAAAQVERRGGAALKERSHKATSGEDVSKLRYCIAA
jgi:hypothetical protein